MQDIQRFSPFERQGPYINIIGHWCFFYNYFQEADIKEVKFIIGLGDNFYYEGVKSVEDPRFRSTFERVYTSPALKAATWYMIAGNHDHASNVSAQIAYTKVSPRWHFPDFFYTKGKSFKIDDRPLTVVLKHGCSVFTVVDWHFPAKKAFHHSNLNSNISIWM